MTLHGFYTDAGATFISQLTGDQSWEFSSAKAGCGLTLAQATTLDAPRQVLSLGTPKRQNRTLTIPVTLDCSNLSEAYELTEVGLYIKPAQQEEFLLFVYRVDPTVSIQQSQMILRFYLSQAFLEADNGTVTIDPSGIALEADLLPIQASLKKKANLYQPDYAYSAGEFCVHNGFVWRNTSTAGSLGVEPGTNDNQWQPGVSNPNLLDNPWFQINQRGESAYPAIGYTVDRWLARAPSNITVHDGYLGIGDTPNHEIYQSLEFPLHQEGTFTASIFVKSGTGKIVVRDTDWGIYGTANFTSGGFYSVTVLLPAGKTPMFQISNLVSAPLEVYAAKLERGAVSTLANDAPPDFGTELRKCQRFFYLPADFVDLPALESTATVAYADLFLPATMRTTPAVSVINPGYLCTVNDSRTVIQTIGVDRFSGNAIRLSLSTSGLPTGARPATLNDTRFALTADL